MSAFAVAALADAGAATHAPAGVPAMHQGTREDAHPLTARRRVRALSRIRQHLQSYVAPRG